MKKIHTKDELVGKIIPGVAAYGIPFIRITAVINNTVYGQVVDKNHNPIAVRYYDRQIQTMAFPKTML